MMMRPLPEQFPGVSASPAVRAVAVAWRVALAVALLPAPAVAHHRPIGSLVRCTSLQQPARFRHGSELHKPARYFAPTSQAVFFAHAGDRCVWRAGTPARG